MESTNVHLHRATDAEDAYALFLDREEGGVPRATRGYGSSFQREWSVELQSQRAPDLRQVDWEAVLERVIEADDLNDPVITDFEWPVRETA